MNRIGPVRVYSVEAVPQASAKRTLRRLTPIKLIAEGTISKTGPGHFITATYVKSGGMESRGKVGKVNVWWALAWASTLRGRVVA